MCPADSSPLKPANGPAMGSTSDSKLARQRRIESSALSAFVPALAMIPFTALALLCIWVPIRWSTGWLVEVPFVWVVIAFTATGPLLFLRPFQILVLTPALGARRPEAGEEAAIVPLWNEIVTAAGLDNDRFVVRILPSDELNAFACGGHLVVVTSFAVDELTTGELQGVLAHELSHHLGLHTVAITIGHWLSLPVLLLARIGVFFQHVAIAAGRSFGRGSTVTTTLTTTVTMAIAHFFKAIAWVFTAGIRASTMLTNLVGHRSEFDADQRAVRMGFGTELASALRRVLAAGTSTRPTGWRERIAASHPPARTRVARVEALLRHPSR